MIILLEFQGTKYKCFMHTKVYCGSSCTSPKIESRTNCKNPLVWPVPIVPLTMCALLGLPSSGVKPTERKKKEAIPKLQEACGG